jgi:hypothetical protein
MRVSVLGVRENEDGWILGIIVILLLCVCVPPTFPLVTILTRVPIILYREEEENFPPAN